MSGGPVAGEAYSAWPTIEQGQQSLAHPRKPLITVSDIEGLPSAARAQWPVGFPRTSSRESVNT